MDKELMFPRKPMPSEARARTHLKSASRGSGRETRVRVSLVMDDETLVQFFRVKIDSRVKPGRVMHIDVPIKTDKLEYRVMLAAGAMAEQMNHKYQDELDPDAVAHQARSALADLQQKLSLGGKNASGLVGVHDD